MLISSDGLVVVVIEDHWSLEWLVVIVMMVSRDNLVLNICNDG